MKKWVWVILFILFVGCSSNESPNRTDNLTERERDEDTKEDNNNQDNDKKENSEETEGKQEEKTEEVEIDYQKVKPNELGHIMIVMYHGIKNLPPYHRTEEDFEKDLQFLYDHGYRLISMRDYLDNNINVPPGLTPIVLTFDDGLSSTFSLVEENGEFVPTPNTAVAILEKFAKNNPDFGKTATFYINSDLKTFDGEGTKEERIEWLHENGYHVANHTSNHADLSTLGEESIQKNIGKTDEFIRNILGEDYLVDSLTYPFGKRPKKELLPYIQSGKYKSHTYNIKIALKEGPSGSFIPPHHLRFDPLLVPRVRGSEGEVQDLWWFLNYYEENPDKKYISDGNNNRISIPEAYEKYLNYEAIPKEKEIYLYKIEEDTD
ncbi:MAG: polysaccharide deacetylase family protein [Eubacteriales bacterium]